MEAAIEAEQVSTLTSRDWTDNHLFALPDFGGRIELISGRINVMAPAGGYHGDIGTTLLISIGNFVQQWKLGRVYGPDVGFRLGSRDLRSPDGSFVAAARLRGMKRAPDGFFQCAPDLAFEVLSPSDSMAEVQQRLADLRANGTRLTWLISPKTRTVELRRADNDEIRLLDSAATLDGEEVLPGFSYPVAQLFVEFDFGDDISAP